MTRSNAEESLATLLRWHGLPAPQREYPFAKELGRRFRADFAYPDAHLLIEVDGGSFVAGRHSRGTGFELDAEKASLAATLGYRVIRVTPRHIADGRAITWIKAALEVAA